MEGVDEESGGLEEDWRDIEDEEDEEQEEQEGEEEGREEHSEDEASSREESRLDDVIPAEDDKEAVKEEKDVEDEMEGKEDETVADAPIDPVVNKSDEDPKDAADVAELASAVAKVSCDIDDDEAMSVEEAEPAGEEEAGLELGVAELTASSALAPTDLVAVLRSVEARIHLAEARLRDEAEKRRKWRTDDCRRVHDYDHFLTTFLAMLTERNLLGDIMETSLGRGVKDKEKEVAKDKDKEVPKGKAPKVVAKVGAKAGGLKHLTKTKTAKKRRNLSESEGTDSADSTPPIMYSDPSLPEGWKRRVRGK